MYTKTNFAGYEKDESTNLVINKNTEEYKLYIQQREKAKEFRHMKQQIERLNKQVAELNSVVQQILNSQSGNR